MNNQIIKINNNLKKQNEFKFTSISVDCVCVTIALIRPTGTDELSKNDIEIFECYFEPLYSEINTLKYFINRLSSYDSALKALTFKVKHMTDEKKLTLKCNAVTLNYYDDILSLNLSGLTAGNHAIDKNFTLKELNKILKKYSTSNINSTNNIDVNVDENNIETQFIIPSEITI